MTNNWMRVQRFARQRTLALVFATLLGPTALTGCGPEQQAHSGTVPVSLALSLPHDSATASTSGSRFWATVQSWLPSLTSAWAQQSPTSQLTDLRVDVTDSDQNPLATLTTHFSQPPNSGDSITIDLNVPVGPGRVFTVSGLNVDGRTTLQGKSGPVTLTAGLAATVDIAVTRVRGTAIAARTFYSCALLQGGSLKCWGSLDLTGPSTTPILVNKITTGKAVAAGGVHTCALLQDGTIWCGGRDDFGELGDGPTTPPSTPVQVKGINGIGFIMNAKAVAAGEHSTCALLEGGTIQCWGKNSVGQLGNGTRTHSSTPVPVKGITNATAVATGVDHSCAVLSDHTIWCWGNNNIGQLGNGIAIPSGSQLFPLDDSEPGYKPIPTPEPVQVSNITTATAISAGNYYSCAVLSDGTIWCWGSNSSGKLGNGTATPFPSSSTPVKVNGVPTRATAVATGYGTEFFGHSCALLQNGTIWCWGDNRNGELGNGTAAPDYLPTPVKVSKITTATAVVLGTEHSCALLEDGIISCWGNNSQGQLGNPSIPIITRGNNRIAVEPTLPVLGIP